MSLRIQGCRARFSPTRRITSKAVGTSGKGRGEGEEYHVDSKDMYGTLAIQLECVEWKVQFSNKGWHKIIGL
jgi:hypothetical protein